MSLLITSFTFQAKAENFKAKYIKNYDGDTITVNLNCGIPLFCKKMSIRVNGIDTPEIKGKCGKEKILGKKAKYFVYLQLKSHGKIDLRNCKKGKYFRLVCDVYYNDILLSQKLLEQNLAVKYDGGKKTKNWCK
jgi:endonuclease YncB( thermonuclease family)